MDLRFASVSIVLPCLACHPQPSCPVFDVGSVDAALDAPARAPRVLLYSGLTGFRHDSIPTAIDALATHLHEIGVESDRIGDGGSLTPSMFDAYGAVVFVSTTGEPLGAADSDLNRALVTYVQNGGGFVGIHSVDDAYDGCARLNAIVGGWFAGHPGDVRMNTCTTIGSHPALAGVPGTFDIRDEFHLLWNFRTDNQVLVTCLTEDGTGSMPISWVRNEGAGRVFVTTFGHPDSTYADPRFVAHILAGTAWVLRQR